MIDVKKTLPMLANQENIFHRKFTNTESITELYYLFKLSVESGSSKRFLKLSLSKLLSNVEKMDKNIEIINKPDYSIVCSYNLKNKKMVLNHAQFDNVNINRLQPKYVYSLCAYAYLFKLCIEHKNKFIINDLEPIVLFYLSLLTRVFGRQYGLMGHKANLIQDMKFILAYYFSISYFKQNKYDALTQASTLSTIPIDKYKVILDNMKFDTFEDIIYVLDKTQIMKGLNKYIFVKRMMSLFSAHILPIFEDFSRFLSILSVSMMPGGLLPNYIYTYNTGAFSRIVQMTQRLF